MKLKIIVLVTLETFNLKVEKNNLVVQALINVGVEGSGSEVVKSSLKSNLKNAIV